MPYRKPKGLPQLEDREVPAAWSNGIYSLIRAKGNEKEYFALIEQNRGRPILAHLLSEMALQ